MAEKVRARSPRQGGAARVAAEAVPQRAWTFLSNHAHVLILISREPEVRLRDIAAAVGITERAATGIINDLEASGYLTRAKDGRRNRYTVHRHRRFRHPQEAGHSIDELLRIFR